MKRLILSEDLVEVVLTNTCLLDKFYGLTDFVLGGEIIPGDFSIYIGKHVQPENYNLQYIFCDCQVYCNERVEYVSNELSLQNILETTYIDFLRSELKVLLYLGKFPGFGNDIDGGSILAKQLIDTLKVRCHLDVAFIRKNGEEYFDSNVENIFYYEYKDAFKNKFFRRLQNLDTNYNAIRDFSKYDRIITAHVSKFFGCDFGEQFWKKTILFPMFCTHSYQRAGEIVPKQYIELEKKVIESVDTIITPSVEEKEDLINEYLVENKKINVIHRGISSFINFKIKTPNEDKLNLICIGSIKKQKNNLMQLEILNKLVKNNINACLNLVTTIQDDFIYNEMLDYISKNELEDHVKFHFSISQKQLADLLSSCDINISTSNWETFGRGIFEGISSGLPTLVNSKLKVVETIVDNNFGVKFLSTVEEFYDEIIRMMNPEYYYRCAYSLRSILSKVSYKAEQNNLANVILRIENYEGN